MNAPVPTPADSRSPRDGKLTQILASEFLHHVPDRVYFKDRDSRFIAASSSICKQFGVSSTLEIIGRTDFDFFSEVHARATYVDEQEIIRTGSPIVGKLERETWPDGRVTYSLTTKMPLRNHAGGIIGTFGISKDVSEIKRTELELERVRKDLMDASRLAGMAEVATGVLHNVGNVLNSLNVSSSVIGTTLRQSKADSLARVAALLEENSADIGGYLANDPKGRRIPELLASLAKHYTEERDQLVREINSLQQGVDHIRDIVIMQQTYATMTGLVENLEPSTLMEDSIRMNAGILGRSEIEVVRDYRFVPPVVAERGKVLQVLVNLIRNAANACNESKADTKMIILRIIPVEPGRVHFVVQDNGVGIPAENLSRIFVHGFTTRAEGHGFGLHSSALAAKELKGSLTGASDGPGKGATFTFDLPGAVAVAAASES